MSTAIVPSMHFGTTPIVSDAEMIVGMVLKTVFLNPGKIGTFNEDEMVSYPELYSKYKDQPETLCSVFTRKLTKLFNRYFVDDPVTVNISYDTAYDEDKDLDITTMTIEVIRSSDNTNLISSNVVNLFEDNVLQQKTI